jgi:hypothetical protein
MLVALITPGYQRGPLRHLALTRTDVPLGAPRQQLWPRFQAMPHKQNENTTHIGCRQPQRNKGDKAPATSSSQKVSAKSCHRQVVSARLQRSPRLPAQPTIASAARCCAAKSASPSLSDRRCRPRRCRPTIGSPRLPALSHVELGGRRQWQQLINETVEQVLTVEWNES